MLTVCTRMPSRLFLKFKLGTHGVFEELGRHANRRGSQECPNCEACKESVEHVLFELHHIFVDYLKQVLLPDAFEAFVCSSPFNKSVFCLGEKQGMLLNDECSSWYNREGEYLLSVWEKKNRILFSSESTNGISWMNPTSECEANDTECYGG